MSLFNTYFEHCHNQPYSYFDEASFRQKLSHNLIPEYLIFAIYVTALRFFNHHCFEESARETSQLYARRAWQMVTEISMERDASPVIHQVQTLGKLAVHDFTCKFHIGTVV